MSVLVVQTRRLEEVNTDPQRRCYHGVHARSEMQWTAWRDLHTASSERVEGQLKYWRGLNDYSVSVGGRRSEYRAVEKEEFV